MITKYTEFLNEKLTDKLSGFNVEEMKQQFLDGKIDIILYLNLCKKYHIEFPTDKEIIKYFKQFDDIDKIFITSLKNNILIGVKYAVEHGSNVNDYNALKNMSEQNNFEIVKYLVEHGADINKNNNESVNYAIINSNLEMLNYFFSKTSFTSDEINHFFEIATRFNNIDIIKFLINKGADIHYDDNIALYNSLLYENDEITKYLLNIGAVITKKYFVNKKMKYKLTNIIKNIKDDND